MESINECKQQTNGLYQCLFFLCFFGGLVFCTCYTLKNKQMEFINVCFPLFFFWRTGFLHLVRLNDRLLKLVRCFTLYRLYFRNGTEASSQKHTYIHMTIKEILKNQSYDNVYYKYLNHQSNKLSMDFFTLSLYSNKNY